MDCIRPNKLICYYLTYEKQLNPKRCQTGGQLYSDTSPVSEYSLVQVLPFLNCQRQAKIKHSKEATDFHVGRFEIFYHGNNKVPKVRWQHILLKGLY